MKAIGKIVFFTSMILMLISTVCFASGNNNIKRLLDTESINAFTEKNEVIDVSKNSTSHIKELLRSSLNAEVKSVNMDTAVKAYRLNTMDLGLDYNKEKKLEKIISNNCTWLVPIIDSNNKIISIAKIDKGIKVDDFNKAQLNSVDEETKKELVKEVKKHENKWVLSEVGNSIPENTIKFLSDSSKIEQLLIDKGISNPSQVKFLLGGYLGTNILYIKDGNQEYGIPFNSRFDSSELKDGELYTIPQIMDVFNKKFSKNNDGDNTYGGYGVSTSMDNSGNSPMIIFSLIIISVLFVLKMYSKKISIKKQ